MNIYTNLTVSSIGRPCSQIVGKFSLVVVCLMLFQLSVVPACFAGAGGFRVFVVDSEAAGKGTAFVGEADNPSAVFYNPAGLTQLKGKNHISVGMTGIQPMVKHTSPAGVETQMRRETFAVPHFYAVSDFGIPNVIFGVGVTSNWGLSTRWNDDSFSRYVATKTELTNMDNMVMMGLQLNDHFALGGGVVYDISQVSKVKAINQITSDGFGQLKGEDDAFGYTGAAMFKLNERHQFGLVYKSEIDLHYKGKVHLTGLNATAIPALGGASYQAVFGGSSYSTDARAQLTLPQSLVLGYSFRPDDKWTFNMDVEWMDWSSLEQEVVTFENETNATRLAVLAAATTVNRDWDSTINGAIGTEYAVNDQLRLRGGYFYNQTPISEGNFDTTVPTANAHGFNLGLGFDLNESSTIDLAYTGMLYEDWDVSNTVGASVGGDIDGKYENYLNSVLVTYNFKFE